MRAYVWWRLGAHRDPPFIDRLYDPVPTMSRLSTPSLWLLAGEDSSAPAAWTVTELDKLRAAGRPVEYFVYPQAEHGILQFTEGAAASAAISVTSRTTFHGRSSGFGARAAPVGEKRATP